MSYYPADAIPVSFIPDKMKPYLFAISVDGKPQLIVDRYEFYVYQALGKALLAGHIFCRDSIRYQSFEDDLVSKQQWENKEQLIVETGLVVLQSPIEEHLHDLEEAFEKRLYVVNERINSGENTHIQLKKSRQKREWSLPYPRSSEPVNHPFFDRVRQVDISTVMYYVDGICQFLNTFDHVLHRYSKQSIDSRIITACIIAWGTNMGLGRMGSISDIEYHLLASISENFIRPETLQAANNRVTNAIAQLPVFHLYAINDTIHSSSDGQKFETLIQTINARHSPKYFELKKGVVAYSLVANHVPVNARIIGAHTHESHYVFDLLYNNQTDIQPTIHSTDTHGTNQVNFAILNTFGYQFAPRYKDIYDKVRKSLFGFQHPSKYDASWTIKPIRKLRKPLVINEWDQIQHIMVSLALKTTTQSIIVRKLSSYTLQNATRQALWEYNNIFQSLYLLDFIDWPPLRRNAQRALNQGESYHKLRRAVSYANFGKLRFRTIYDQQLWSECSRLIANCVIFYNASILSSLLLHEEAQGVSRSASSLRSISPVAWQHVNFFGRYQFIVTPEHIHIEELLHDLISQTESD